jgi:DNA-binding XRE family transcriptional regulator
MKPKTRVIENVIEIRSGAPEIRDRPAAPPDEAAFKRAFNERIAKLRTGAGITQAQAAAALGIRLQAYQHFEYRSPMPAYLIAAFAAFVGSDIDFVLTGEGGGTKVRSRNRSC